MQIKEFYLDLREWPQYAKNNNNVWLLESEAFKEPLKFTFKLDLNDIRSIEAIEKSCKEYYEALILREEKWNAILESLLDKEKLITEGYQRLEEISDKYDKIIDQIKRKEDLIKEKELKENHKIGEIQKIVNLLEKKIDLPEPQKIYSNSWDEFIAGDECYICYPYKLPAGDYVILEQYEYDPKNEYVLNQDEIKINQVHLEWQYFPMIKLYSENAMDKPVAKVRLNILFFQI